MNWRSHLSRRSWPILLIAVQILVHHFPGIVVECVGQDREQDRWLSIDILEELAPLRANLTGVVVAPGPYGISPALYFTGDQRQIKLLETSYVKVTRLLQSHHDITFMASVRQEPFNVGSLFSLSSGFTRFLELQSSGRKDEIRLHYTGVDGVARVETFRFRLADGAWHRVAVTVSGGVASLYIDCRRVDHRWMAAAPDTSSFLATPPSDATAIPTPSSAASPQISLWIGQRADHFLFKGAMQDVRLVAGVNGHVLQCPLAQAECPTCGEFHSLRSVVARLEKSLQHLSDKLEEAEERISQLEQCDCPRSCEVNGTVHQDATTWQSDCQTCTCQKGEVVCGAIQCPVAQCRNPVLGPADCCPTCLKRCYYRGLSYDHGERVSPRQCMECVCLDGSMQCRPLDPQRHCPPLSCPVSQQFSVPSQCCKQCPGVDHCAGNDTCDAHAQCINLQTTFACQCLAGYSGDGKHCTDIDECTEGMDGVGGVGDGGGGRCGSGTQCVNTLGSYECQCLAGYVRSDNVTCSEHDECATGLHGCHDNARCHNTPGGYQCHCNEGYHGDGVLCTPVCEAACQNGGVCVLPGECRCRLGFAGARCQLDVDECATGLHRCSANSHCVNMPGWYTCTCKPGFRAPTADTLLGTFCQDVDECAEGLHTCHGGSHCVNTQGSYECHCPSNNVNCSLDCSSRTEGSHANGDVWTSHENPCVSCECRNGVAQCSRLPCDCSSSSSPSSSSASASASASTSASASGRAASEQCCPQCRSSIRNRPSMQCRHQELNKTFYDSGQRWIYQCQSCECLHGETDCWPMECPPINYCSHPVQVDGDCCLRCPDSDPCSALTSASLNDPVQGCHYQGLNYTEGSEWTSGLDDCTTCKCRGGAVCCSFDANCYQRQRRQRPVDVAAGSGPRGSGSRLTRQADAWRRRRGIGAGQMADEEAAPETAAATPAPPVSSSSNYNSSSFFSSSSQRRSIVKQSSPSSNSEQQLQQLQQLRQQQQQKRKKKAKQKRRKKKKIGSSRDAAVERGNAAGGNHDDSGNHGNAAVLSQSGHIVQLN